MRRLTYYLENPFDDPNISIDELLAFTTDHLQRMIANNSGGELSPRITATTSSLGLVEDCVTDDETKLGLRKSRKMVKDTFRKHLPENVAKIAAVVVAEYGPNAPEVVECCPRGRRIFGECRDDQVEGHLQTLVNGVTAHQADLGAQVVTNATALKDAWVAVHDASETTTGNKTATEQGKKMARDNLQLMLFLTLNKLMEMFPRQPEKLALYMQQSLLENPSSPPAPEPPPPPPPPPPPAPPPTP